MELHVFKRINFSGIDKENFETDSQTMLRWLCGSGHYISVQAICANALSKQNQCKNRNLVVVEHYYRFAMLRLLLCLLTNNQIIYSIFKHFKRYLPRSDFEIRNPTPRPFACVVLSSNIISSINYSNSQLLRVHFQLR